MSFSVPFFAQFRDLFDFLDPLPVNRFSVLLRRRCGLTQYPNAFCLIKLQHQAAFRFPKLTRVNHQAYSVKLSKASRLC